MKKKINILITGCGGDIGQSIGKILLNSNYTLNLFGVDITDKNPAQFIYPNFSIGLRCDNPKYLESLEFFINKHRIDLLIPVSESEIRFFSINNILNNVLNAKILIASSLALEVGLDKYRTFEFLKNESLPYPKTKLAKDLLNIEEFPVILKLRTGSGSKQIFKINTFEEFVFFTKNSKSNFIVQEYISDECGEFTCGLFRSRQGEIRSQIFKRELAGGYSGFGEVVKNNAIKLLLERLAVKLDLIGSINVQLRLNKNIPIIFEINPRFSSTVLFRHLLGFEDLIWSIQDNFGLELSNYHENAIGKKFFKGFQEYIK